MIQHQVKRKRTCFNAHFQYSQSKITKLNKMWSIKSLAVLKCESRTSLHAVKYNLRPSFVLLFCSCFLRMGSLGTLFLCSAGQQTWLCA